jgi:hypothetical protein
MILDLTQPVELQHPFVRDRALWLYGFAGSGGRFPNIMPGDRGHGTNVNGPLWSPTGVGDHGVNFFATNHRVLNAGFSGVGDSGSIAVTIQPRWSGGDSLTHVFWTVATATLIDAPSFQKFENNIIYVGFQGGGLGDQRLVVSDGGRFSPGRSRRWVYTWNRSGHALFCDGDVVASGGAITPFTAPGLVIGNYQAASSDRNADAVLSDFVYGRNRLTQDQIRYELEQSRRGYRTPDSPLRWIRGTAFGLPLGGGGGSVRIPRFILQTRRRLTGVS